MKSTTHTPKDFDTIVDQLGGAARLEAEARATGAFQRAREVKCAVDMLRLVLAYCLGPEGLRLTAAWAEAVGLVAISNVAVLQRVRNCVPWLEVLVARRLLSSQPPRPRRLPVTGDRPIRIVDATVLAEADKVARDAGGVWRVHAVLDLNDERFSVFELTDEKEGERLDAPPLFLVKSASATAPICSPTGSPRCWRPAATSSSARPGMAPAGSTPTPLRSI